MGEREVIISREGCERLEMELEQLKTVRRSEVIARIREAREFGPITENPEYEEAKKEQAFVEGRILTIENLLNTAQLIEEVDNIGTGEVQLGSRVQLKDLDSDELVEYTVVSSAEVDPLKNETSNKSPVGRKLLESRLGDVVEVETPGGRVRYKVLGISS